MSNTDLHVSDFSIWVHVAYLFTKSVQKSCDLPDWFIKYCINLRHHVSLKRLYDLTMSKTFSKIVSM